MEKIGFINVNELASLTFKLTGGELKLFFIIVNYLSSENKEYVVNNVLWREYMDSIGFRKTPETVCSLFSSLTKKGLLERVAKGVYCISNKNVCIPSKIGTRIFA